MTGAVELLAIVTLACFLGGAHAGERVDFPVEWAGAVTGRALTSTTSRRGITPSSTGWRAIAGSRGTGSAVTIARGSTDEPYTPTEGSTRGGDWKEEWAQAAVTSVSMAALSRAARSLSIACSAATNCTAGPSGWPSSFFRLKNELINISENKNEGKRQDSRSEKPSVHILYLMKRVGMEDGDRRCSANGGDKKKDKP